MDRGGFHRGLSWDELSVLTKDEEGTGSELQFAGGPNREGSGTWEEQVGIHVVLPMEKWSEKHQGRKGKCKVKGTLRQRKQEMEKEPGQLEPGEASNTTPQLCHPLVSQDEGLTGGAAPGMLPRPRVHPLPAGAAPGGSELTVGEENTSTPSDGSGLLLDSMESWE
ncbi:hypothetical protein BTVI_33563 [Pitangus sulphuratus]|nr:hypothetical protein BTVI_33563 [Pitangus sulphuratus]